MNSAPVLPQPLTLGWSLLYFGLPALMMIAGFYLVMPFLIRSGMLPYLAYVISLGVPLLILLLAAILAYRIEGNPINKDEEKMTESQDMTAKSATTNPSPSRVGFYSALFTVLVTRVTFAMAITAVPISGANCPSDCVEYPYLNTVAQYPKDFLWMIPAMLLVIGFVALMVSLHANADERGRV